MQLSRTLRAIASRDKTTRHRLTTNPSRRYLRGRRGGDTSHRLMAVAIQYYLGIAGRQNDVEPEHNDYVGRQKKHQQSNAEVHHVRNIENDIDRRRRSCKGQELFPARTHELTVAPKDRLRGEER